jgi:aspartyl-tRNA synthetase
MHLNTVLRLMVVVHSVSIDGVMLMAGGDTIRDVIPFPKNNNGRDMMMDAPGDVDNEQLKIVGVKLL